MKIALIGATGKSGQHILNEALQRGIDVTAFVRSPDKLAQAVPVVKRDVLDISQADLAPFDVIISAYGNAEGASRQQHVQVATHLAKILKGTGKRLLLVGAASYLYVDATRTQKLYDTLWMRAAGLRSGSLVLEQAYQSMRDQADGFTWTYLAPAVNYNAAGKRTGHYQVGSDIILKNSAGKSMISYADYAIAMVDEVINATHPNQLVAVAD